MRRSRPVRVTVNATDVYQKLAASMAKAAHVSVDALTGTSTKASNPKEAFGDAKMPLDLFPDTALVQMNLAFLEGALKYGQYNWRIAGVKVSTYIRAARRHLSKFWNGQDVDPVTLVNELASVGACVAIMLDAMACGKLTDDRPPRADMEHALARAAGVVKHLKALFKDHTPPPQYTEVEHGEVAQAAKRHAAYMATMAGDYGPDVLPKVGGFVPMGTCPKFNGVCTRVKGHSGGCWLPAAKKRNPTSRKKLMAAIRKGRKPRGRDIDPNG